MTYKTFKARLFYRLWAGFNPENAGDSMIFLHLYEGNPALKTFIILILMVFQCLGRTPTYSFKHFPNPKHTPRKINMSPENQWLEDVFPIETVTF